MIEVFPGDHAHGPLNVPLSPDARRLPCRAQALIESPAYRQPSSVAKVLVRVSHFEAKAVSHAVYVALQLAEVAVSRTLFAGVLQMIGELRPQPVSSTA